MKKILSLIALLVVTLTAFAETTSEKIIPDGTQPNGGTITPKAITVDWATQKIVANVDLTNCLTLRPTSRSSLSLPTVRISQTGIRKAEAHSTSSTDRTLLPGVLQLLMFISFSYSIAIKAIAVLPNVSTR